MNTHSEYRRHNYRPTEQRQEPETAVNGLAHHRDPSLSSASASAAPAKRIAWVRPTELASYAGPLVGRGIDLQAELIRRARRTPVTTKRAIGSSQRSVLTPPPRTNHQEGLQL